MLIDPLSDVLAMLQPHTYVAGGFDLGGRWSIGFDPHTGLKCYSVMYGQCWIVVEDLTEPVSLSAGDCILLPNGRRFRFTNDLSTRVVQIAELHDVEWRNGIATVQGGGDAMILGGHFAFAGAHADVLLGAMPPMAHLHDEVDRETLRWVLNQMRRELSEARPGGVLVAQHLAHMMLVQALRLYLAGSAGRHVGWLFALGDPKLASAIAAVHARPGEPWSLSALAAVAGMSRSSFAREFKKTVGTSAIDYVTRWRMLVAGSRLALGAEPVSVIAHSLGYESETSFSTAFRRTMGHSPREHARKASPPASDHPWSVTSGARRNDVPTIRSGQGG